MSYKRDGDDSALLYNLQHRRVAELLGNHIPEYEALLLSNGRLTCLICSFRPVFDNISTLAVHRQGKKHILELSRYLKHKADLESRATKQTQQTHMYSGLTTKEPATSLFARRTPCKSRRYIHDRHAVLDTNYAATPSANVLTQSADVLPSPASLVRKYLKSVERSRPLHKVVEKSRESYGSTASTSSTGTVEQHSEPKAVVAMETEAEKPKGEPIKLAETPKGEPVKLTEKSGWRLNKDGDWEKDPEAEFESEDEDL